MPSFNPDQYPKLNIPEGFLDIAYNGKIIPDGNRYNLMQTGANCQVFAYEILRYNGYVVPDLRSSELWEDQAYSEKVLSDFQALDILFFNKSENPYGAHLGIYLGEGEILHHAKRVGKAAIWSFEDFEVIPAYRILIGGKRFYREEEVEK